MKKNIFLLSFLCLSSIKAQITSINWWSSFHEGNFIPFVNYSYADRHIISGGMEYPIFTIKDNSVLGGLGYGVYWDNGNINGLLHWHLNYINYKSLFAFKLEGSQKHINPSVGLSFLSLADLTAGYSFPFKEDYPFKGFTISLLIRPSLIH